MSARKVLSIAVALTGVYFIGRQAAPDLGEVLDYVNANPQHQELILNRTMYDREKKSLGYSTETLGNFSRALLFEFSHGRIEKKDIDMKNKNQVKNASEKFSEFGNYFYDLIVSSVVDGFDGLEESVLEGGNGK